MLCKPGMKLLDKSIHKPKFESDSEIIKLNLDWKHANILVKLVTQGAAKKKTEDVGTENRLNDEISKERGAVIDGAVVKIMKTNKDVAVSHMDLIVKTTQIISLFKA